MVPKKQKESIKLVELSNIVNCKLLTVSLQYGNVLHTCNKAKVQKFICTTAYIKNCAQSPTKLRENFEHCQPLPGELDTHGILFKYDFSQFFEEQALKMPQINPSVHLTLEP